MVFSHYSLTNIFKRTIILYVAAAFIGYTLFFSMIGVFAQTTDPAYEQNTGKEVVDWCGGGYGDFRSYCRQNCTSYVAYKLAMAGVSSVHYMKNGDGKEWLANAKAKAIPTGSVAKVGAVGYWTSGDYGHVAWVDSVNADGSANTSNYNGYTGEFYKDSSVRAEGYIYFSNITNPAIPLDGVNVVSSLVTSGGVMHVFTGDSKGNVYDFSWGGGYSSY